MVTCYLKVCNDDMEAVYGITNLCVGLEAGISGVIHSVAAQAEATNTVEFGSQVRDQQQHLGGAGGGR